MKWFTVTEVPETTLGLKSFLPKHSLKTQCPRFLLGDWLHGYSLPSINQNCRIPEGERTFNINQIV